MEDKEDASFLPSFLCSLMKQQKELMLWKGCFLRAEGADANDPKTDKLSVVG